MFYNRTREAAPKDEDEARLHGIAFAELVAFMEDMRSDGCAPVFKLADLADLYKTRLEQLGATVESRIHTTRLKLRLLSVLPDLRAYSKGRDMLLTFTEDIGDAVQKACAHDSDADKTSNKFSAMATDQCHEQNNAGIKGSGGAV